MAALGAVTAAGFLRLELDMDLFSLLPADSSQVAGLKLYQQAFGASRELVISLRAEEADAARRAARSLAGEIEDAGLSEQVLWQNPLEDPEQLAALVAFLWFNQPPEQFRQMTGRFTAGRRQSRVDETLERMASSLDPEEVARLARDPYALMAVLREAEALPGSSGEGGDPLVSADGRFRIVLVAPPFETSGFARQREWTEQVRSLAAEWAGERSPGPDAIVKVTGNPAMVTESGTGLLQDIRWAAAGTLAVVSLLFWLAHRSLLPLGRLVGLLAIVLGLTLGLGGLLMGRINIVSLGFATILLGLAADYGLILHQELRSHPERSPAGHRRAMAPGILWAALTTAGAFFMLTRSSLPGVEQLGVLVGLGVLTAAAVMLVGYLGPARPVLNQPPPEPQDPGNPALAWSPRAAWTATAFAAMAAALVILFLGPPAVDYGAEELGFRQAPAREALAEVEREVGERGQPLWILVPGADVAAVSDRLERAEPVLQEAAARGVLSHYVLPGALWPNPEFQRRNRERLGWLVERRSAALDTALDSGFTDESMALTGSIFAAWRGMLAAEGIVWPRGPGAEWILRQFSATRDGHPLVLGQATPGHDAGNAALAALGRELQAGSGADLLGWSLLSDSLLGTVDRDARRVLLPMLAVLVVLLAAAFRHLREVVLSMAVLGLSAGALLALMKVAGWRWNLMNIMALALLLGTAVDYSIHIQHALRRYRGEAGPVRRTVGRAILLCGASTAAGFGTLGFASNEGLASLGRVCAVGTIIACLVSVYLLPAWWRVPKGHPGTTAVDEGGRP